MCGARGHRNGKTRTSLSNTMPRLTGPLKFCSFWPRTTWQWSPIPHTHPICPPVTFSSSPSWSFGWRVEDSTPLKRFKRNCSWYLKQFQKGTSRDASKHGRKAGTDVFVQNGSTLKVMEEFNIQGKQTSFYRYCPGTFVYILVFLNSYFQMWIMWWVHTRINLTVKDKTVATEAQLLKYFQLLTFLENKRWWQFSNWSNFFLNSGGEWRARERPTGTVY